MKKMGLGRGLDALLPELDTDENSIRQIPLNEIDRNPRQPRATFDEDALKALSDSIRQTGVLQPLLVTQEDSGRYQIVAGERRFRAARMAGLSEVPVIIREMSDEQAMQISLIENLQREDLNPMEEAEGIRSLMDQAHYTQEQVAERLGRSRPAVANTLRLLTLPADMQTAVRTGRLSAGHGRALAGIRDDGARQALFQKALRDNLSVRQLEMLAADQETVPDKVPSRPRHTVLAPELQDMQERLRSAVGIRRVTLKGSGKKGSVVLSYDSAEELEMIYAALETLEGK